MVKFPSLKCPICAKKYTEVPAFGTHVRKEHPGTIPEDWSDLRYAYFAYTGRTQGHCRECGGPTPWNETTGNYAKICTSPACKKKYRDRFMASMRKAHGKDNLLDDPKYRERMLTGRKISGTYVFQDGGEVSYMGQLEKKFLEMLDKFFRFPSCDIMSPSPNRYIYHYTNPNDEEHEGEHIYVPDFYIPSCNLEIELKTSKNERPRNLMIDVPRDACKDVHMIKNPGINYVKVYEDDYHVFFQVFADLAMQNQTGEKKPIKYISRALLTSIYRDYIPDEILKVIDAHIYKYSDKSVLKKRAGATESTMPVLETPEDDAPEEETGDVSDLNIDEYYDIPEDVETAFNEEAPDSLSQSTGAVIVPLSQADDSVPTEEALLSVFDEQQQVMEALTSAYRATEAIFGLSGKDVDTDKIDARAAVKYSRWRDKLFGGNLVGSAAAKTYVKVSINNGMLQIRGINCNLLLYRIKETYAEGKLKYIFQYAYNAKSMKLYEKRKIGRGDMKIDYVYAPEFFCLELIDLFRELGELYHDLSYMRISELIYEISWMSKADKISMPPMSTAPLKNLALELMPHQVKFIESWPQLKSQLNLNGYVLSFKPGKGKTLTAVGLAECLHAPVVYIVCPNNLKDNWALEIKKYYAKYADENLWKRDVCILGSKFGDIKTAKFVIVNNESIKLMLAVAKQNPDAMLILDECHNFRNYAGGRTKDLFALADKIQSKNVLCVSATPIKASPAEITPVLYLIDPTFTDEAAAMYAKCFDLSTTSAMSLINKRFGMIIYRPADAVVDLPAKNLHTLPLRVTNEERFYMANVHDEIITEFKKRHEEWLKTVTPVIEDFRASINKWARCDHKLINGYLQWVIYSSNSLRNSEGGFHELDIKDYKVFIETNIRINTDCPPSEVDRLLTIERELITAAKRHMGYAIGGILPHRRNELYIRLYEENRETFYEMIRNRGKKTVIFSTMVPVIRHIVKDLQAFGIGTVCIMGETKNRLDVLNQFREDPNTLVLVATSWCMGVGVTLTEASQMFFFGTPWRSTDFEQACDRIWRIGQTEEVDIYTVMCQSKQKNLSDRMQDILEWSNKMFDTAITAAEVGDDVPPEQETMIFASESVITLDDSAMEALFRTTSQMLGGVKYDVNTEHILCVLCNCTRDHFFNQVSSFPPIARYMKKYSATSVIAINDCIDVFNEPGAIDKLRAYYRNADVMYFYEEYHNKCRTYDPKQYAGKRIMPELIKETLKMYTTKFPEHLVILFLETAYNYPAFMEYPVLRLAVGTVTNTIWNIEDALNDMHRKKLAFGMSDPSLRGKGTKVPSANIKLYHVSPYKFDALKPQPTRTPLFGENVVIERASAAPDVDACFRAVGLKNFTVYHVYELQLTNKTRVMKPNVKTVPDAAQTGEHWVLDEVKVKCIDSQFVCADSTDKGRKFRFTNAETTTTNPKDPNTLLKVRVDNKVPIETGKVIFTLLTRSGEKIGFAEMNFMTYELIHIEIEEKFRNKWYATTLLNFIASRSQRKFTARGAITPNDTGAEYVAKILQKLFAEPVIQGGATESVLGLIPATESIKGWRNLGKLITTMEQILSTCQYGMLINGKVEDPDDDYYEQYYRTVSPGIFIKQRCGTCYDFAAYQDFFLKAHNVFCANYFIEVLVPGYPTHTFTVIEHNDRFIYFEHAFGLIAGVYQAYTIDEIVSFILVNMAKMERRTKPYLRSEFKVYRMKSNYSTFGESLKEFADRQHATGKELQFRYNPSVVYLEPYKDESPAAESTLNMNRDDYQYEELSPDQVEIATKVYAATELPIHTCITTYNYLPVSGSFPQYMQIIKELRNLLGKTHNIATYVLAIRLIANRNPEHETMDHLVMTVPFNDGAIIPEFGLTIDCNGLYFADTLPNAILGVAQKMGEARFGGDFILCPENYDVKAWLVMQEDIDNIGIGNVEDWYTAIYDTTNDIAMNGVDKRRYELHKIEVLKHGWIARRY